MERRHNCRFDHNDCVKTLSDTNILALKLANEQKPLPLISAMIHAFKSASRGETTETFRPLLKVSTYAGIDRRKEKR